MGVLDPWHMDIFWYTRMNSAKPRLIAGLHDAMSMLTSCTKVFDIVARLVKRASLPLPMPNDNIRLSLMEDWRTFTEMTTVVEPRRMVKSFILRGVELRAWAVWAMFQFIDSLAAAHGLPPLISMLIIDS